MVGYTGTSFAVSKNVLLSENVGLVGMVWYWACLVGLSYAPLVVCFGMDLSENVGLVGMVWYEVSVHKTFGLA